MASESSEMTGGEVIVEMLRRFDVEMMFGLPGDQTHLYDALYRQADIRHVLVRHEQAAAHMADAYARKTGKVERSGDLETALAEALANELPAVVDVRVDGEVVPERTTLQTMD